VVVIVVADDGDEVGADFKKNHLLVMVVINWWTLWHVWSN
jgi:hypothetical protein